MSTYELIYQSAPDVDGYIEAYVKIGDKVHFIYPTTADKLNSVIEALQLPKEMPEWPQEYQ